MSKENILVVDIEESKDKPHRCSSGFYVRRGAISQKLTTDKIRDFIINEGGVDFGTLTCKKFDYKKHFSKEKFFSFLEKAGVTYNKRDVIYSLESLGVAQKKGSKLIFNNAGALFFSKDLDDIHFHAKISCALFKGKEKRHVLIEWKGGISPPSPHRSVRNSLPLYGSCLSVNKAHF